MILIILLLGILLRLVNLSQSFWIDEATSAVVARDFSLLKILNEFSPGDFHPPLYYLVLKGWVSVFGVSEISVRLLSVGFGVATVLLLYLVTKRLFSKRVGIISSLLLSLSPLHIYYSQEARMYAMAGFLSLLTVWIFIKIINSKKAKSHEFVTLAIVSMMLIYTNYVATFTLVFLIAWLVLKREILKRYSKQWIFVGIFLILGIIFLLPLLVLQFQAALFAKSNLPLWWEVLGKTNLKEVLLVPVKFMLGRISFDNKILYAIIVLVTGAIFAFPLLLSVKNWKNNKFIWFWFLIPLLSSLLQGIILSGFSYFRLVFLLPVFYLLISVGIYSINSQKFRTIYVVFIIAINLSASLAYFGNTSYHREDWKGAVSYIEGNSTGTAKTIFVSNGQREAYNYYSRTVPAAGIQDIDKDLDILWLMRYVQPIFDPKDDVRKSIESRGYEKLEEKDFNGVTIWKYTRAVQGVCIGGNICIR